MRNADGALNVSTLLMLILTGLYQEPCCGQVPDTSAPQRAATNAATGASDKVNRQEQRRLFKTQELITAKPNSWLFKPGATPRIIWRDVDTVRQLSMEAPLRVRWFNSDLQEAAAPDAAGRWAAWIETTAPNSTPVRRALTFFVPDLKSLVLMAPEVNVDITLPQTPEGRFGKVWQEHHDELSRVSSDLLRQNFLDRPTSAVVAAGLAEAKPLGRPARYVDSFEVLDQDFHLALKLKLQGLDDDVRSLQKPRQRTVPATRLHAGSLDDAGMQPDARDRINAVCRDWAEDTGEPFVTLVARNGVIVTHEAFGTEVSGQPIDTEYRCWVASITKSVTSLLFSRFVDQKLIGLDDSLAAVFPDYPEGDPHVPTFHQCLNHTSGLTGHGEFGGFRHPHLENVVLNGIDVNEPGVRYQYCGLGFDLVAKAMEIVTGRSAVRLYHDHLFEPLGFGDVVISNGSSDGHFTAMELGILAQWVANRGSYGDLEFISPETFDRLLPRPLDIQEASHVKTEGIGLHWIRHLKPGTPRGSTRPEDQLFSLKTVGHGSFSGCIFVIDLEQNLVITQARRQTGPRHGEWSAKFFQTVAEAVRSETDE